MKLEIVDEVYESVYIFQKDDCVVKIKLYIYVLNYCTYRFK